MDQGINKQMMPGGTAAGKPQGSGLERLLKRRAKPLPADLFIRLSEWVAMERRRLGFSQKTFAFHYKIPLRQVKTYEAVALRWSPEAKSIVIRSPEKFRVGDLTRLFANRSWKSNETLLNALKRHAEGKAPRKPYTRSSKGLDPNLLALEERLRDRLRTRVEVNSDGTRGELRISFFSLDDLERLLTVIEN